MLNKALHTTLPSFMESALTVRLAVQDDLFEIITLLSDDPLGRLREIDRAKEKGCCMVQLTTDKKRPGAVHFYETLGFAPTHEGMKLKKLFELIALAREGIFWPLAVLLFSAVAMAASAVRYGLQKAPCQQPKSTPPSLKSLTQTASKL